MTSSTAPSADDAPTTQKVEPHDQNHAAKLNWLRAGVLGANDGIVSVAGLVIGVAGATQAFGTLLATGVAGVLSGALSMAAGEYVSVSTQRDTEKALLDKERHELAHYPEAELEELTQIYEGKGLSRPLAEEVARSLTAHDAFAAHVDAELGIDPDELTSPTAAAVASALSFLLGALIPTLAILFLPPGTKIVGTVIAVVVALAVTGYVSARMGGASVARPVLRNVVGGLVAMGVTYWIGRLIGTQL